MALILVDGYCPGRAVIAIGAESSTVDASNFQLNGYQPACDRSRITARDTHMSEPRIDRPAHGCGSDSGNGWSNFVNAIGGRVSRDRPSESCHACGEGEGLARASDRLKVCIGIRRAEK